MVVLAATPGYAASALIEECQRVEVIAEDAGQEHMARKVAQAVCRRMRELGPLFGGFGRSPVRVRICADMETYRKRTGRPWYLAAVVLGDEIVTQPARSLVKLDDLEGTLAHELVHLLVRRVAGRNCPRWLDEGLAQWLAGQKSGLLDGSTLELPGNPAQLELLENRLASGKSTRQQMKQDYRTCLGLVDRLIGQVGKTTLVGALGGLKERPDPLTLPLGGKPLGTWIFCPDE
jgi:hypothetical protein